MCVGSVAEPTDAFNNGDASLTASREPSPTHHPLSHKGRELSGPTAQISLSNMKCPSNAIFLAPTLTDYFEHDEESVFVDDEATNRAC